MKRVFQQIPVRFAVFVPFPEHSNLIAHEIQFFSGVGEHVYIESAYLWEFCFVTAGHLLDDEQLPASRALSLASCFRAPLADPIADQKLAEKARRAGTKVFADAKLPLGKLPGIESYGPFFANVDYFFPNESEAAYYSGVSLDEDCGLPAFEKAADFFRSLGVRNVVIKAGSRGCYLRSEKDSVMFPALAADVIDTTGAGDSFVAGFIRAFLAGKDNRDCCRFALRCAAATVGALGATSGIRDRLVGERLWAEFTAR